MDISLGCSNVCLKMIVWQLVEYWSYFYHHHHFELKEPVTTKAVLSCFAIWIGSCLGQVETSEIYALTEVIVASVALYEISYIACLMLLGA